MYKQGVPAGDTGLKCCYTNANSLMNNNNNNNSRISIPPSVVTSEAVKLDEFRLRLIGYDIIGVVETWANYSMFDSELQIPGYG